MLPNVAYQGSEELLRARMPGTLKEQLSRRRKLTLVVKHSGAERGLPDNIIRAGVFATCPSCYRPTAKTTLQGGA